MQLRLTIQVFTPLIIRLFELLNLNKNEVIHFEPIGKLKN